MLLLYCAACWPYVMTVHCLVFKQAAPVALKFLQHALHARMKWHESCQLPARALLQIDQPINWYESCQLPALIFAKPHAFY